MTQPLITKPGAYPNISNEDYHRNPNLLPGPSLSSTGAKKLAKSLLKAPKSSPYHFWWDSPMNPQRPPEREQKSHLVIGKAAHDMILLPERWKDHYFVTPKGFNASHTKKWEQFLPLYKEAVKTGKEILNHKDAVITWRTAGAIRSNELAMATLTGGVTEETLVWQDPLTGVWLRARPDFRPNSIVERHHNMVVSDLKFMAPTHCPPSGFERAIEDFGYHQSAAFYIDGIKSIYGVEPTHWVHVVVEKPAQDEDPAHAPYSVSLYELPRDDIERGRLENRRAINLFARCLERNEWPSYADKNPMPVGLTEWARNRIEDATPQEYAYASAASDTPKEGTLNV